MSDDEFDIDDLFAAEDIQDTNSERDEYYRHRINKIKKTFARHPTGTIDSSSSDVLANA